MLNVGALREGYVLDHIKAGKAMTIYHDLKLDKLDCTVAIIKNARSNKMGKKGVGGHLFKATTQLLSYHRGCRGARGYHTH